MRTVGAYEAKTHLPRLLQAVEQGETIVITRHGKEIARLIPPAARAPKPDVAAVIEKWKKARKGLTLGNLKLRDLIEEGRR